MAEELSKREQRRADRRENRHGRKQARIDRVQRKIDRTTGSTGSEDDLREARLKNRVQRIQNRKDKIGEGADAFRESWKRRRTDATSTDNVDASGLASADLTGSGATPPPPVVPEGVPTEGAGSYGHEKATTSMGELSLGSNERKAEYDRRGWAYDDTIAGDHEGAWKSKGKMGPPRINKDLGL